MHGDHAAATAEADQVATNPNLNGMTLVHLARVYALSIEALLKDAQLSAADRDRTKAAYATRAITCLHRAESSYLAEPGRLNELDSDDQLNSVRTTDAYRSWRAAMPRSK